MAKVIATQRGYYGGMLRDDGASFDVPDEIMKDAKRRPSWVKLAAFGGKGDHDGDGMTGGAAAGDDADDKPKGKGKGKGKAKIETVDAPEIEPFADAPEPVRVDNEINAALGTTEPDWIAPGGSSDEI